MIPKILKNFNLFVDGTHYAGLVDELSLPKLALKTEEHRAGGMDIPIDFDMGMEKLDCDFTLCEYRPEVLAQLGIYNNPIIPLNFKGALNDETGVIPVEVEIRGTWRDMEMGSWKAGDKATLKVSITGRYYKLTIDGNDVVEIDSENLLRSIGGTDQLAEVRTAIGL
jgi:Bacteriophage tail tube protein